MKHSVIETAIGALIIFVAVFFLALSYRTANVGAVSGYEVIADFSTIGGLKAGDDVALSGVKIGTVKTIDIVPESYMARTVLSIRPDIILPEDTSASIRSLSLLGGLYVSLEPGASDDTLAEGDRIEFTQSPQNLEELLGKFIFSQNQAGAQNAPPAETQTDSEPDTAPKTTPGDRPAESDMDHDKSL